MKRVLVFTPFCYWNIHTAYELTIAKGLQIRNAELLHITCNKDIPYCDIHDGSFDDSHICNMCISNQNNFFKAFKLKRNPLSDFYNKNLINEAIKIVNNLKDEELLDFKYKNSKLGLWIQSSVFTYFRINEIEITNAEINKRFREYLIGAVIINDAFENIIEKFAPEVLLMFNGRFFTFRIPFEIARSKGIRTIVHDRGYRDSSIIFKENEVIQGLDTLRKLWNDVKEFPLRKEEVDEAVNYLIQREKGKNTGWYTWVKESTDYKSLINKLDLNPNNEIYSFYTSSDDELAAFKEWSSVYSSQSDFILHLTEYFIDNPKKQLIIRIHPNSAVNKGNRKENTQFLDFINQVKVEFSDNIKIIYPEDDINSYQLIKISNAVITYFSTVTIEATARLKPVLITGGGPYHNLEFINTLKNKKELFYILDNLPDMQVSINEYIKLIRFVYNYFIRPSLRFSLITQKDPITPVLNFKNDRDLQVGKNEDLDRICNAILYNKKIYDYNLSENANEAGYRFEKELINEIYNKFNSENKEIINIIKDKKVIKMEKKLISVIIPTYNRADILKMCLDALSNQTINSQLFEVIVIDDGSKDSTSEMIKNYNSKYKLKYIIQENSGPGAARNKGIKESEADLLLIINDDTICEPDNLQRHLEAHKEYNDKIAVLGTFDYTSEAQVKPFIYYAQRSTVIFAYPIMKAEQKYNYRFFWTCNLSIKKSFIEEVGYFDEDFSEPIMEDTEIGYRLQKIGVNVLYYPKAKSIHYDFNMDSDKFAKRQFMLGRNIVKFLIKHPELFEKEKDLFGFYDISLETINILKNKINSLEDTYNKNLSIMKEIDKLEIFNPNFIPISDERNITSEELIKVCEAGAMAIHYYNFYSGVIYAASKINSTKENTEKTITTSRKSDNIRILITMYGWNDTGGGTMFPKAVAENLAENGYEVAVFYAAHDHPTNNQPYFLDIEEKDNLKLYGVYNRITNLLYEDKPELEIYDMDVIKLFDNILDEFQPNVVHYFNFLGLSFGIADEVKKRGIRSFYSPENYHLIDPKLYMFKKGLKNWNGTDFFKNSELVNDYPELHKSYSRRSKTALDLINNQIDYTLSISERVKEILIDFGANYKKIKTVHQIPYLTKITDINNLKYNKTGLPVKIGFIGTVIPQKGVHNIIMAAKKVPVEKAEFRIYGYGNKHYENEMKKLNPNQNIKWMGKYEQNQLEEIGKELDLMIISSIWEECAGLVVLESIALKVPVIVARIGGMPEFVLEGFNGYTYPHNSVNNLAAIINYLIEHPQQIDFMKRNCLLPVNFEDYTQHLIKLYENKQISQNEFNFTYKQSLKKLITKK